MKIKKILPLAMMVAVILSCKKDEEEEEPAVLKIEVFTIDALSDPDGGVTLKGEIKGSEGIRDYGFILSQDSNFYFKETFSFGKPQTRINSFEKTINSGLRSGFFYYFKSYIEYNKGFKYGERKKFLSKGNKGPVINSVTPSHGHFEDTIQITGKNFGSISSETSVLLDTKYASIISVNDSVIKAIVPDKIEVVSPEIMVSCGDKKTRVDGKFKLFKPEIFSFSPNNASFRDLIEIKGEHFDIKTDRMKVYFGQREAKIAGVSRNSIIVLVPDEIEESSLKIKVRSHLQEAESGSLFQLTAPTITKAPISGKSEDEVIIEGTGFHPNWYRNKIYFGGAEAMIVSGGKTSLKVKVPTGPYPKKEVTIKVGVLGLEAQSVTLFKIEDVFRMVSNTLPFYLYSNALGSFVVGKTAYVVAPELDLSQSSKWFLWVFNPSDYTWQKKTIPFEVSFEGVCYGNGEKGYLYVNNDTDNFYEYNPSTDSWTKRMDLPGGKRGKPAVFAVNSEIYMGLGGSDYPGLKDFYKYSPSTETWTRIKDLDMSVTGDSQYPRSAATTFTVGGSGYVGGGATNTGMHDFWKYTPSTNTWAKISNFPYALSRSSSFAWNGKGYVLNFHYVGGGDVAKLYEFDPLAESWKAKHDTGGAAGGLAFVLNNIIYSTGGDWPNYSLFEVDMSKF